MSGISWIINHTGVIEGISFVISAIFFVMAVRLMIRMNYFSEDIRYRWNFLKKTRDDKNRILGIWKKILDLVISRNPDDWKQAALVSDSLLDEVLKIAGYRGNTVEERLSHVDESAVPTISGLRRVRTRVFALLAEAEPHIEQAQIKELLREYRHVFRQLGIME